MSTVETLRKPFKEMPDGVCRTGSKPCDTSGHGDQPWAEGQGEASQGYLSWGLENKVCRRLNSKIIKV